MDFIDTHAHLYLKQFHDDIDEVLKRTQSNGIRDVYLPNIDSSSIHDLHSLQDRFPQLCHPMMGLHPCSVKENFKEELKLVTDWLDKRTYAAVGEIGIDLYWDKTFYHEQIETFKYQIQLAKALKLPFVIHSRDSLDLTIKIVEELQDGSLSGIFHCFNGTLDQGKRIIDIGFYLGIGGVITFKNAGVAEVVQKLPISHMVLETDAPYLSPVPYRGKRNESSYIKDIAEKLAQIMDLSLDEVSKLTTINARNIFSQYTKTIKRAI